MFLRELVVAYNAVADADADADADTDADADRFF